MPPKPVPESNRKRHKITDSQRAALRARYATQKTAGGAVDHKSLAQWFQNTYQFPIDLSMVSRYLGPRYKRLDAGIVRPDASKQRVSSWPVLEEALFSWQQRAKSDNLAVSGDILKEKAAQFWPVLYPNLPPPKFSTGWLDGFKARHSITIPKKHGQAAGVDIEANVEDNPRVGIRTASYGSADSYNMDEPGFYYEPDEEVEQQPIITPGQALEAAKVLELWYLQQKDCEDASIEATRRQIGRLEVAAQIERQEGRQGKLNDWVQNV